VHSLNPHKQLFKVVKYFVVFESTQAPLSPFSQSSIDAQCASIPPLSSCLLSVILPSSVSPLDLSSAYLELLFADL
jgi:hypothetical protein